MPIKSATTSATVPEDVAPERACRCEATIAASVLDGFACGNPECWRTAVAKASFDAFVADLIRRRDGEAPSSPTVP